MVCALVLAARALSFLGIRCTSLQIWGSTSGGDSDDHVLLLLGLGVRGISRWSQAEPITALHHQVPVDTPLTVSLCLGLRDWRFLGLRLRLAFACLHLRNLQARGHGLCPLLGCALVACSGRYLRGRYVLAECLHWRLGISVLLLLHLLFHLGCRHTLIIKVQRILHCIAGSLHGGLPALRSENLGATLGEASANPTSSVEGVPGSAPDHALEVLDPDRVGSSCH